MRLHVADHPLIDHKLSVLRDQGTPSAVFRQLVDELVTLLAYEATRDVRTEEVEITTPVALAHCRRLAEPRPIVVPILRAGLGMVDGVLALVPTAKVGHIGLYRDPQTLEPVEYYCKMPADCAQRDIFVLDPMLATGGSASAAITMLKQRGCVNIRFMCIIAAPDGIERLQREHPDVDIFVGAKDDHLNEHGYIVPGLGDAGDRIFGTK